ncbi:hypothetical protein [Clostridium sp. UBA3061]|uniref:hypothetical protein n=1 Tax=Clostridium sp. UBA3061 TaxID=1946353 RepID=UPI003216230E
MNNEKIVLIRDTLVIISTIITLFTIFVKIFSNIFKESIKSKFKYVPEDDSLFNLILQMLAHIISSGLYLLVIVVSALTIYIYIKNGSTISDVLSSFKYIEKNKTDLFADRIFYIQLVIVFVVTFCFINCYERVKNEFVRKFSGVKWVKSKRKGIKIWMPNKKVNIRRLKWYNRITKFGSSIISFFYAFMFFIAIMSNEKISYSATLSGIFLICAYLAILIIAVSLDEIIEVIAYYNKYEFILDGEKVICECFLEYKQHYLIYESKLVNGHNNIERYIRKNEVKEIRKICGDKIVYNKTKRSIKDRKTKKSVKEIINTLIKKDKSSFINNTNKDLES